MNSKPLISVIIPVYNVEKWLNRCIDSIIGQTYTNLEIILVDDGSTDKSADICDEYAKIDKRIKVIHKENGGLSDARNVGFDYSRGEYIGFIDSDDYVSPDMFEQLINSLTKTDVEMVICNCTYVDEDGIELEEISPIKKSEVITSKEYLRRLSEPQSGYYITAWNRLYKKEILSGVVFPKGKLNEDSYIVHRIINNCKRILVLENSYYYYNQRESSLSRNPKSDQYFDIIEALIDRIRFYEQENYQELLTGSINELVGLFIQIRRHYLFRGKKTIIGLRRAAEIKREVLTLAKENRNHINKTDFQRLIFVDFVIALQIIREKLFACQHRKCD